MDAAISVQVLSAQIYTQQKKKKQEEVGTLVPFLGSIIFIIDNLNFLEIICLKHQKLWKLNPSRF
jgi:hypothetical protein